MPDAIPLPQFFALLYADIFDFPLTKEEMETWSIDPKVVLSGNKNFISNLPANGRAAMMNPVGTQRGANCIYFCLRGREEIINLRQERETISQEKRLRARKASKILKTIPTIRAVFLTGNVAVGNSKVEDDIDLLLVTTPGTIWVTRLMAVILTSLIGARRKAGDKVVKNLLCLNMFIDEDHLSVPKKKQSLYLAHEVLYASPVFDRGGVHQEFIKANGWVKSFLPNAWGAFGTAGGKITEPPQSKPVGPTPTAFKLILRPIERLAQLLQVKYMEKHRTSEVITEGFLSFHPQDKRLVVEKAFGKRLWRFNLIQSKILRSNSS
jgi:hypothetical protein